MIWVLTPEGIFQASEVEAQRCAERWHNSHIYFYAELEAV
jgi:hypothetical protein